MAIMPLLIKLVKFSVFSIHQIKENGRGRLCLRRVDAESD